MSDGQISSLKITVIGILEGMSSSEPPLDSVATNTSVSRKGHSSAWWALIGALAGSLVSGAFSVTTAIMTNEANEKAAVRAQEASEKALNAQRRQAQEQFLRDQRAKAYQQFLSDSQAAEDAQLDYAAVLSDPRALAKSTTELTSKYNRYKISFWSIQILAPSNLQSAANELDTAMSSMLSLLPAYGGKPTGTDSLGVAMDRERTLLSQARLRFASIARETITDL